MGLSDEQSKWLSQSLRAPREELSIRLIAGDASPRRYYRVAHQAVTPESLQQSVIFAVSPPSESNEAFAQVRALLAQHEIRVPDLIEADLSRGFFVLEDLGNNLLLEQLDEESVDQLYKQALNLLVRMQTPGLGLEDLPIYDKYLLQNELDLFLEWFVDKLLDIAVSQEVRRLFRDLCDELIASGLEQPRVFVHRDFHSRNLMCLSDGDLATIDFQDAVVGPITYDVVSLLKDCYVEWPRASQLAWLREFWFVTPGSLSARDISFDRVTRWYDLMGLQRHIKVLGIFARLSIRDSKHHYLSDLPRVIRYIRETLLLYRSAPDIQLFAEWFEAKIMPQVICQPWFSDAESL